MDPRRILAVVMFLAFAADANTVYGSMWVAPFGWAAYLFEALPYKIRLLDHFTAYVLWVSTRRQKNWKAELVLAMRKSLILSVSTLGIGLLYGLARGGSMWAGSWQVYLMASGVLFAFAVAAACRTTEDFALLEKALLAAAAYRAVMCVVFYFNFIRNVHYDTPPEFLTSHDDTVLWVTSILILLEQLLTRTAKSKWKNYLFLLLLFAAVIFNRRRLAWVSLVMGMAFVIVLMRGPAKKRTMRGLLAMVPVIAIYIGVGWGRPEGIFSPLRSLSTVSTQEDASTKARNAENMGLITTSNMTNILTGSGWGHPYYEYTNKYSISQFFPLWQFIPHNSILALLAFSGVLGFYGYWLAFPTAMFMNARVALMAQDPVARRLGVIGAAQAVVCANQYYGDMGSYFPRSVYILALSYAIALRMPIQTGAWTAQKKKGSAQASTGASAAAPAPNTPGTRGA